jgi:uncharacterized protein YkwD
MIPGANIEEVPVSATGQPTTTVRQLRGCRALVVVFTLLILFACAVGGMWSAPAHAATDETVSHSDEELTFVWLLNDYRVAHGLQPLLLSDALCLSADRHSSDMGTYRFFSHRTGWDDATKDAIPGLGSDWFPKGYWPWDRMRHSGYDFYTSMGENIAAGYLTAQSVFNGFKASPGHNQLMLSSSYRAVGVSLVKLEGSQYYTYWTVDFGGYVDPSAHETGLFQQNDSRLCYLGNWTTRYSVYASRGSSVSSWWPGAAVCLSFEGTGVDLIAKVGPDQGVALVSLDGGAPQEVDLYRSTAASQQVVYESPVRDNGPHSLMIQFAGKMNPNSSGWAINLDAIRIVGPDGETGTLIQATQPVRHEQNDGAIKYVGPWSTSWTTSTSGGTFKYANAPGAAVNVKFNGTYLAWLAKKGPAYGKAQVSLDGGPAVTVDLYSSYNSYKQKVYNTGLLEDREHTLSIYWTGQKNWAASGYNINVDAFELFGDLVTADDPVPITWLYENTDSRLTYLGPWLTRYTTAASGGSFYYTSLKGAVASVDFTGTGIEVLARTGPAYSEVNISLDGDSPVTVDLHSDVDKFKQSVYTNPAPLSYGKHTLTVEYLGWSATTGGWAANLDAFKITGTMTQAAKTARIQQTDTATFGFTGNWATSWTSSASAGSLKYSADPLAEVTITFNGTFFAWLAKASPAYGVASVSVDGGEPTLVDLYSAATLYKKLVFASGTLTDGEHHVTIKWTGNKNPAAAGTYINVDAADILASTP